MSDGAGLIKIHRAVAAETAGRWLDESEHVHHEDENPMNWSPDNLVIMTPGQHNKHHAHERSPAVYRKCGSCGKDVRVPTSHAKYKTSYCNVVCMTKAYEHAPWPSDADLALMLLNSPANHVAKELGISEAALRKRCYKRKIKRRPQGYWQRHGYAN
jgi:hypothetical protein